jgi:hypothetical protein
METVLLIRTYHTDFVTIGQLFFRNKDKKIDQVATLELPWKENQPNISCIPVGRYKVKKTYSPHFKKNRWEVQDVNGRSGIRIHIANYVSELKGCIAPGLVAKDINFDGIIDVKDSKDAYNKLEANLPDEFYITIVEL